jgi:acyl carrier protein
MTTLDTTVLAGVLALLDELKGDWEYDGEILPGTGFVADLGLESLEIVVLSTMIQQLYGRLPFPEWFDEIGQRPAEARDVTVAELVTFISEHRKATPEEV